MKILKSIILVVIAMLLSSCYMQADNHAGRLQIDLLRNKLLGYNISIIQEKKSMIFVLPNDVLFNHDSANFAHRAYGILDSISDLINYYDKTVVSAIGFDGYVGNECAHKVAQYLWNTGMNINFVYAAYGKNKKPICTNCVVLNVS